MKQLFRMVGDADVINLHGHPYFFSFIVTVIAKIKKKPIVLTQHNTEIRATSHIVNLIYALSDRTFGKFNLNSAAAIVTVSDETKKYITALSPKITKRAVTIYNGIDAEHYKPVKDKRPLRKKLGLPADAFICFTIRRITFKNGIDTLLSTARLSKNENVRFVIGGTGPDLEVAKKYVASHKLKNVDFLGFVSDEDLPKYYACADSFILPSRQGEGFPMVVLEAFAAGLPIIATKSGGHIEVINSRNGFLVDPESPSEIVDCIEKLQHKNLVEMAVYCRGMIQKRFTWDKNVDGLVEVIQGVSKA